jgi:glycosyltransferase involved in cell wall biosynthesis
MNKPLISIITPCLNRVDFIGKAVESVLAQGYPSVEHIVMDAGSTDGTLEILRTYPHLRVVSEPDDGMYNAINKGLRLAKGQIIGLLNSDDLYAEGCFDAVVTAFEQNPNALAVVGGITTFREDDDGWETKSTVPAIGTHELWPRLIHGHPVTNAWFFLPEVFSRLGGFDERLRWSADRYFLIHVVLDGGVRPVPIPRILYHYRQHSGSVTITTLDSRDPRYGLVRIKTLQEDIFSLNELRSRKELPPEVFRLARREHGERCYRLAATAAYHRRWGAALEAVRIGWRANLLWPFIFFEMAIRRLFHLGDTA